MDIRAARKAEGMTQEELAQELKINRATLSKYESGIISPTLEMLGRIAIALNRPVTDILGEDRPDEWGFSTNEKAVDIQESIRENQLLLAFYGLNYEGQNKVIEYAEDLSHTDKYKIHTDPLEAPEEGKEGEYTTKEEKPPERL